MRLYYTGGGPDGEASTGTGGSSVFGDAPLLYFNRPYFCVVLFHPFLTHQLQVCLTYLFLLSFGQGEGRLDNTRAAMECQATLMGVVEAAVGAGTVLLAGPSLSPTLGSLVALVLLELLLSPNSFTS